MAHRDDATTRALVTAGFLMLLAAASGCVSAGKYQSMLREQEAIESALRNEIAADQVEIEELKNGIRVRMSSDLLYGSGSVELTPEGRAALDKVAPHLAEATSRSMQIDVVGNTDDVPIGPELSRIYPTNWELAAARATVVVRHLQQKGVDPRSLEAISNGQYHPVADNGTAAGRAKNRRTDLLMRPE